MHTTLFSVLFVAFCWGLDVHGFVHPKINLIEITKKM